jgi:hypothetical protein
MWLVLLHSTCKKFLAGSFLKCERGDSNPHALRAPDPKSGASTSSATFAAQCAALFIALSQADNFRVRETNKFRMVAQPMGTERFDSNWRATYKLVAEAK